MMNRPRSAMPSGDSTPKASETSFFRSATCRKAKEAGNRCYMLMIRWEEWEWQWSKVQVPKGLAGLVYTLSHCMHIPCPMDTYQGVLEVTHAAILAVGLDPGQVRELRVHRHAQDL